MNNEKEKNNNGIFIYVDTILNLHFISSILENLNQTADQPIFILHLGWHFPTAKTIGDIFTNTTVKEGKASHVWPEPLPTASLNISVLGGAGVCRNPVQSLRKKMLTPFESI